MPNSKGCHLERTEGIRYMDRSQSVALITGASSGFGMGTSLALAVQGYRVIATMREISRSDELIQQARQLGITDRIEIMRMDVTEPMTVKVTIDSVMEQYGRIDVLINNAGYAVGGFIEEVPMSAWREQMETNVFGIIEVTRAVIPYMREKKSGCIINVSSVSGRCAIPGYGPYCTSKFAVEGFSETLRLELRTFGIRVVLIEPGAYRTNIWRKGLDAIWKVEDSPYKITMDKLLLISEQSAESAPDPREVIEQIGSIVNITAPKLRYVLGRGARVMIWGKSILPWSWYERIVARVIR